MDEMSVTDSGRYRVDESRQYGHESDEGPRYELGRCTSKRGAMFKKCDRGRRWLAVWRV